VPAQIWNNLGVLCHHLDELEEANACYKKAFGSWEPGQVSVCADLCVCVIPSFHCNPL
jgi:hypothetical protein